MSTLRLGLNIQSLTASRYLNRAEDILSRSFARLSTGSRINQASDDAAGLSVSSKLNADARIYGQAYRNINDGISRLNIADGAVQNLSTVITRLSELAEQASNGTFSTTQRRALDKEAYALVDEFNRIIEATESNDINLLDGTPLRGSIQAGFGTDALISYYLGSELTRTVGNGRFQSSTQMTSVAGGTTDVQTELADINGDGNLDLISASSGDNRLNFYLGNGDGTFQNKTTAIPNVTNLVGFTIGDFDGDSDLDIVAVGDNSAANETQLLSNNGTGSFSSIATPQNILTDGGGLNTVAIKSGDINGDGILDIVYAVDVSNRVYYTQGNGDGTFKTGASVGFVSGTNNQGDIELYDYDNDGDIDILQTDLNADSILLSNNNGSGVFTPSGSIAAGADPYDLEIGDINRDGYADIVAAANADQSINVFMGNGDGTFADKVSYATGFSIRGLELGDFNNDGLIDVITASPSSDRVRVLENLGDGVLNTTLLTTTTGDNPLEIKAGDFNNDGVLDIVTRSTNDDNLNIQLGQAGEDTSIAYVNLLTQDSARSELETLAEIRERIASELGSIGSTLSRFNTAASHVRANQLEYLTASGRITNIDVAEEAATLIRSRILEQAGIAILAQANQAPSLLLDILRNSAVKPRR